MKIELVGPTEDYSDLLSDLMRYKTFDYYFAAICAAVRKPSRAQLLNIGFSLPEYVPLNCMVRDRDNGYEYWLLRDGVLTEDASMVIDYLKHLPVDFRSMLGQHSVISADMSVRDLLVAWD